MTDFVPLTLPLGCTVERTTDNELGVQSAVLLAAASSDPEGPHQKFFYCENTDCCCERHLAPSKS